MRFTTAIRLTALGLVLLLACGCAEMGARDKSYRPKIDPANFQAKVDHPYFPLEPGTTWKYVEKDKGQVAENIITVTPDKKTVMGVPCTVVHDVVKKEGRVAEDTYDWYAQDKDGNVWYFGETTKEISPGGAINTEGSWEGGVGTGQPGIIMPANPKPGKPYRQEYSPGHAEDMGQVVGTGEAVTVPAGSYSDTVKTKDWSLLEPGHEHKWYAKGVGVVRSQATGGDTAELISMTKE
jgi:hypothetical protein